jgi:hypothetical protein
MFGVLPVTMVWITSPATRSSVGALSTNLPIEVFLADVAVRLPEKYEL